MKNIWLKRQKWLALNKLLNCWKLETSVGRLFAMLHACLAQAFACVLLAIAVSCSRGWIEGRRPASAAVARLGRACCALLFLQLAIAAVMRHSFAGLAIPTFPYSTPEGAWLPREWGFRVGIHFAHRTMAAVLSVALVGFAVALWRDRASTAGVRAGAVALVGLLFTQVALGATIIATYRAPAVTTGHVLVGALTLAATFWLTWLAHRDRIEQISCPRT